MLVKAPAQQSADARIRRGPLGACAVVLAAAVAVLSLPAATTLPGADAGAASPATAGMIAPGACAMAHCDQALAGNQPLSSPAGPVSALWHDTSVVGSVHGLGCSTNTKVVACSFVNLRGSRPTLKVYSPSGDTVWSSSRLNGSTYASAPMVGPDGSVIAADNRRLVRFGPGGNVIWQTATPGGTPISPTATDSGAIVLATDRGPVSIYDPGNGATLATLMLTDTLAIDGRATPGYFDTENTPAVIGDRVYIVTRFRDAATGAATRYGRLYAIDVNRDAVVKLHVAWTWDFTAPSNASPLAIVDGGVRTIYFDGDGSVPGSPLHDPRFFAVTDTGTAPQAAWTYPLAARAATSAAQDPRGGLWVFAGTRPDLIRLDQTTGAVLQRLNADALVGEPGQHVPGSALSVSGPAAAPVLTFSATPLLFQSAYVVAVDLNTGTLRWKFRYDEGKSVFGGGYGQWPIATESDGRPAVIFTTAFNGVWAIG